MASADQDKLGADLSAHLDGELTEERARQVEKLLAESEDARRTLAKLRGISRQLGDLPRMRAPDGLSESLSHSAERQVLLQQRPPIPRARLLKLVGQITASAALIAACMFAGWTVLQRVNAPAPPTVSDAIVAAEPPGERGKGGGAFARRFSPAQPAPTEAAKTGLSKSDAEAPAVVMLERLEALGYLGESEPESGTATPTGQSLAAAKPEAQHLAFGAVPIQVDRPTVNIVIAPRNAEQFNAALRTVAQWQEMPPETTGRKDTPAALSQRDFVVQVPAARFHDVLQSLNQQAPEQVQVVMNFNADDLGQVRRMVTTADTQLYADLKPGKKRPAHSDYGLAVARADETARRRKLAPAEEESRLGERLGGRGGSRGRVARTPVRAPAAMSPAKQEAEEAKWTNAHPVPESLRADRLQPLRSSGCAGDSDDTGPGKGVPSPADKRGRGEGPDDQRQPPVEDVAADVLTRLGAPPAGGRLAGVRHAPRDADATPGAPRRPATLSLGGRAAEIRDHLAAAYEILLDIGSQRDLTDERFETRREFPPFPVTLHVTVLPPPTAGPASPSTERP